MHRDSTSTHCFWSGPGFAFGEIRPIGACVFGDLFFERRSGEVIKLDVLDGGVYPVATSFQQFSELMNSSEWQEHHLLSQGVALLKEKGGRSWPKPILRLRPSPFIGRKDRLVPSNAA